MAGSPEERYIEWLEREEEILGASATIRGTMDIEEAKRLLYSELGYEPSPAQLSTFMEAGQTRYAIMPEVHVSPARFERPWGYQMSYRDTATGRFMSYTEVGERISNYYAIMGY